MKRFLMAFCSFLYFANAFALTDGRVAVVNHQENKGGRVLIPDVALEKVLDEDAVYKNGCTGADGVVIPGCKAFTEEQKTLMLLQFAKTVDNSVGSKSKFMSGKDFVDVCKVGGIKTQAECYSRVFYPTLTKLSKVRIVDACKTKVAAGAQLHCIDAFADLNLTGPQAYGLIYKYTDKYDHFVMCHPIESKAEVVGTVKTSVTSDGKDVYMPVMCTTIDNGHFYTFKFRGIDNTNDLMDTSVDNLKKGMCKLWNTKYVSMNEHVPSGCLGKCNQEILEEFGLKGRQVHVADKGDICEITQQGASEDTLKTYPGHESMTYVFKDVQTKHDNQLEDTIRRYVELVEKIDVSSFKCQYTPQLYEAWNYKDRALRCKINDIDVDFVFDDLSESGSFSRAAGAQGVQCILAGGRYAAGKDCRGITRERCESMAGTRWDPDAEVCILETVESKKLADFATMMAGGLVLSVVFLPAAASGAVIAISAGSSVAFDVAFAGIERLEMLAPSHRARDFAKDVQACNIPIDATSCTAEQHTCAQGVIRDNFKRLEEILMDLNDDQLAVIDEMWGNVAKCLDDGELSYATTTSDTNVYDKALAIAPALLFIGSFVCAPEKTVEKLTTKAPKLVSMFRRAGVHLLPSTDQIYSGEKIRKIYLDNINLDELNKLAQKLKKGGLFYRISRHTVTGRQSLEIASKDVFSHPELVKSYKGTIDDVANGRRGSITIDLDLFTPDEIDDLRKYLKDRGLGISSEGDSAFIAERIVGNGVGVGIGSDTASEILSALNDSTGMKWEYKSAANSGLKYGHYRVNIDSMNGTQLAEFENKLRNAGVEYEKNELKRQEVSIGHFLIIREENIDNVGKIPPLGVDGTKNINVLKNKLDNFEYHLSRVSSSGGGYAWEASRMSESEWQQLNQYLNKQGVEIVNSRNPANGVAEKVLQRIGENYVPKELDIFSKVYTGMPEDVLHRKLDYIYSVKNNGGTNQDIVEAMKRVGAFDERQAGLLAQDITNETIRRISDNPDIVMIGKNWRNLSDSEKVEFVANVHDIVTRERRARVGDTQLGFKNDSNWGWHRAPSANNSREFNYNIAEYKNAEDALTTIIHENVHSFQSVNKSSIPEELVRLSEQHYVTPEDNFNVYRNVLIEIEARYVSEYAAPRVSRALGW